MYICSHNRFPSIQKTANLKNILFAYLELQNLETPIVAKHVLQNIKRKICLNFTDDFILPNVYHL